MPFVDLVEDEFSKCRNCGGALACYSIAWSNLPDDKKCLCSNPQAPEPPSIGELVGKFVEFLKGVKI
jgi:hypothetical protein